MSVYWTGWLDALDSVLQLLDDVDRGIRDEQEVREEIERKRLKVLRDRKEARSQVVGGA